MINIMSSNEQESLTEDWNVCKQTMRNVCKVQPPTERPISGAKHSRLTSLQITGGGPYLGGRSKQAASLNNNQEVIHL
jgi:hypothetical protein